MVCRIVISYLIGLCLLVSYTMSCEDPGRWVTPCGEETVNMDSDAVDTFLSIFQQEFTVMQKIKNINRTIIKLTEGRTLVNDLKNKYDTERIMSNLLIKHLETFHLENFPSTTINDTENAQENITQTQTGVFKKLSEVAVFVEAIREDEAKFEMKNWYMNQSKIQDKIYDCSCEVVTYIVNSGSHVHDHVQCNVMSDKFRSLSNRSERYMRDYVILKDTVRLFDGLIQLYASLRNNLSFGL